MWCNHAFHQRKKATKRAGGWKVGGGWRKFEKGGVGNVGRPSGNRGVYEPFNGLPKIFWDNASNHVKGRVF